MDASYDFALWSLGLYRFLHDTYCRRTRRSVSALPWGILTGTVRYSVRVQHARLRLRLSSIAPCGMIDTQFMCVFSVFMKKREDRSSYT